MQQTANPQSATPAFLEGFMEDEDEFCSGEWLNSAVKLKAQHQLSKKEHEHTPLKEQESWDDDFEQDSDQLIIPESLQKAQQSLWTDSANLKKFGLHMQDLKISYETMKDLSNGLQLTRSKQINALASLYSNLTNQIEVLIELAEFVEEKTVDSGMSVRLESFLQQLLGEECIMKTQDRGLGDLNWMDKDEFTTIKPDQNTKFQFNTQVLPHLIQQTIGLKLELEEYISHLRKLATS